MSEQEKQHTMESFWTMIRNDPNNDANRLVFADWCEEHGEIVLAGMLRGGSEKWLRNWADKFNVYLDEEARLYETTADELGRAPTYEEIMRAATNCLDNKQAYGDVLCLSFVTPEWVFAEMPEFWRHFEVKTGRRASKDSWFIRCAC
jgi:uncharacterized protein (TIGR02996 family)